MPSFTPIPGRDAWFVLRGYRYQVEHTILCWLSLAPDQQLCLECGEDIDIVTHALAKPQEEFSRDLVQIKHLDSAVTLRSRDVLKAIANFVAHQESNPAHGLRFRFCTTAQIGRERPVILDQGMPCLEFWENVRSKSLKPDVALAGLRQIRAYLVGASVPDNFDADGWRRFQAIIEHFTDEQLGRLVERMEWVTGAPESQGIEGRVIALLRERGITEPDAHQLYPRLFLAVFKAVSQRGAKVLTPPDLQMLLSEKLGDTDRGVLDLLGNRLRMVERRVDALEDAMTAMRQQIGGPLPSAIWSGPLTLDATPPPHVARRCARGDSVSSVLQEASRATWLHLYGGCGTGKTELALLVIERMGIEPTYWVALRDQSVEASVQLADGLLGHIGGTLRVPAPLGLGSVCAALQSRSKMVFDDLPRLVGSDGLSSFLLSLVEHCSERGIHVVTASAYPLPQGFHERLGSKVYSKEVPRFTDPEAKELLLAYGGPEDFLTVPVVRSLNALAQGNPALLAAHAQHLRGRGWVLDKEAISQLLAGTPAAGVTEELMSRLSRDLEPPSRELLYRLCIVMGPFDEKTAEDVAAVPVVIPHPRTTLSGLLGPWVQRVGRDRMAVSPLVRLFGGNEIAADTRKGVHATIAGRLLSADTIQAQQLPQVLAHLLASSQTDRAAFLLVLALSEADRASTQALEFLLAFLPPGISPPDVGKGTLVLLRTLQAKALARCRKSVEHVLLELDGLIEDIPASEQWALIAVGTQASVLPDVYGVARTARWLARSAVVDPKTAFHGHPMPLPTFIRSLAELLWMLAPSIGDSGDLLAWLESAAALPDAQRSLLMTSDLAHDGCLLAIDGPWMKEHRKATADQDWPTLLSAYKKAASIAISAKLDLIYAFCVRSQVVILSEYLGQLPDALSVFQEGQARTTDGDARFILLDIIGRQYVHQGRPADGVGYLAQAAALVSLFPGLRQQSWLWYSVALGSLSETARACEWAERAVALCREHPEKISDLELAIALGEASIAHTRNGNHQQAFALADEAITVLTREEPSTEKHRQLLVGLAHVGSYLAQTLSAVQGLEGLTAPVAGMLLGDRPQMAALFTPEYIPKILTILALLAQRLGETERASKLANNALEAARRGKQFDVVAVSGAQLLHPLVTDKRFDEAIYVALESTCALKATDLIRTESINGAVDMETLLGPKPNENWRQSEHTAIVLALPPIVCRLGLMRLDGEPVGREVESVCCTLRNLSKTASDGPGFEAVAQIIERGFGSAGTLPDYLSLATSGGYTTHLLGYLAVSERQDAPLVDTAACQAVCLPEIFKCHSERSSMCREIITLYLDRFWNSAFQAQRFRFTSPWIVEADLKKAREVPVGVRAQSVMRAVLDGLSIGRKRFTESQRAWLAGKDA